MVEKRRGGLGRGLAALIAPTQIEENTSPSKPLDIFFPEGRNSEENEILRGGSARDLLNPRVKAGKKKVRVNKNEPVQNSVRSKSFSGVSRETSQRSKNEDVTDSQSYTKTPSSKHILIKKENEKPVLLEVPGVTFGEIPLTQIIPNRKQPRQVFDEDDLDELVKSIKLVGILQPIIVRPLNEEAKSSGLPEILEKVPEYELIMGERRWRASALAGMETIPAIVKHTEETDLLRDALLENLHRSQLNPLEEAAAYQQLMEDFGCTQEELSTRIVRSRPHIANTLRLLKLPPTVQRKIAAGVISAGHARAILRLTTISQMEYLADRIISEGLSVRSAEEIASFGDALGAPKKLAVSKPQVANLELLKIAEELGDLLDTRVSIVKGKRKGKIIVEFAEEEDLIRIVSLFEDNS